VGSRGIDVIVAVITAKGEIKMNDVPEKATNSEPSPPSGEPTPAKKRYFDGFKNDGNI
jgi:hypothetical protein